MSPGAAESLYLFANAVLAFATIATGALIVVAIRRRARTLEPLGVLFCAVFLAIGVRASVRLFVPATEVVASKLGVTLLVVDWIAAAAAVAFLSLYKRYDIFVESADMAREVETKEREARALAQVNEELRRLDELKSEFLAMVSHELRTPLTAIIGYSRLLIRQAHGQLNDKQLEHQEAIYRSALRLSDLINDLLDVSRLEAGRVELAPRPTRVRQIVDQAISIVTVAAQAKHIRVENDVSPELAPVNADSTRFQQVLVNLIGNGVKFTPAGGRVVVSATPHGDQAWITVQDSGVGIAKEELARIWDPFYQVESPLRRRHGGSGLGLTIVRRLVELHGGVVRAESDGPGRGSRFTFTLPIAPAVAGEAEREIEVALEPVLAGRRVLIVEDEPENQALLRSVIEDLLGGQTTVCDDGERALYEALKDPPALILLDLMLPRLSGWEVARRLRQSPRTGTVPIIAVSALARTQEREAAVHAGCDAYLAKPFTPENMARIISATLARRGAAA